MKNLFVSCSKGQLKIQQMAFVLVALVLLFGMAALFYFSFEVNSLKSGATDLRQEQAKETVRKMSASPELSWTSDDCSSCIDEDKALALKNIGIYKNFWGSNIDLLQIKVVYPSRKEVECTESNYPNCNSITIIDKPGNYTSEEAYVAVCRFDATYSETKCELGKIIMGAKSAL